MNHKIPLDLLFVTVIFPTFYLKLSALVISSSIGHVIPDATAFEWRNCFTDINILVFCPGVACAKDKGFFTCTICIGFLPN